MGPGLVGLGYPHCGPHAGPGWDVEQWVQPAGTRKHPLLLHSIAWRPDHG